MADCCCEHVGLFPGRGLSGRRGRGGDYGVEGSIVATPTSTGQSLGRKGTESRCRRPRAIEGRHLGPMTIYRISGFPDGCAHCLHEEAAGQRPIAKVCGRAASAVQSGPPNRCGQNASPMTGPGRRGPTG